MIIYDKAENNIQEKVMNELLTNENKHDELIDETLHKLMTKDKEWGEGGTSRIYLDKY